jgi:hypothetical protein
MALSSELGNKKVDFPSVLTITNKLPLAKLKQRLANWLPNTNALNAKQ